MDPFKSLYVAPGLAGPTSIQTVPWQTPVLDNHLYRPGYDGLRGDDSKPAQPVVLSTMMSPVAEAPVPVEMTQQAFAWGSLVAGGIIGYLLGRLAR